MRAPKPGIYRDIAADKYHRWDAMHSTLLKVVRTQTPAHALEYQQNPPEETNAMKVGTALHLAVLEPETFENQVILGLDHNRRGNANQEAWALFEKKAAKQKKIWLTGEQYAHCEAMAEAVRANPRAMQFLDDAISPGMNEVSMVWKDPETGLKCKSRVDRLCRWKQKHNAIVDVKTTAGYTPPTDFQPAMGGASTSRLEQQIGAYGYDMQSMFYEGGAKVLAPADYRFFFIFVEKTPPYAVHTVEPTIEMMAEGQDKVRMALRRWAKCVKEKKYPAYGMQIDKVSLRKFDKMSQTELEELVNEEAA